MARIKEHTTFMTKIAKKENNTTREYLASLIPFGTSSTGKTNLSKFWFTPIFHSQAKLGTVPEKSLRLLKFDVTNGYIKSNYYRTKKDNYSTSFIGMPYVKFKVQGYYGNGTPYTYTTDGWGSYNEMSTPIWYRYFCGKFYQTDDKLASANFIKNTVLLDDFVYSGTGYLKSEYINWFKWDGSYNGKKGGCYMNATIVPYVRTSDEVPHVLSDATKRPWGFLIGLANNKIWPKSSTEATFGILFSVPKSNTLHNMCMYFKYGSKEQMFDRSSRPTSPYHGNNNIRKLTTICAEDDNAMSAIKRDLITSANAKMVSVDNNYKYFVIKGDYTLTSANCIIFTPPWVRYSGNQTQFGISQILDSWISFRNPNL